MCYDIFALDHAILYRSVFYGCLLSMVECINTFIDNNSGFLVLGTLPLVLVFSDLMTELNTLQLLLSDGQGATVAASFSIGGPEPGMFKKP